MKSSNKTMSEMPGQAGQGQLRAASVPAGTGLSPDPHSNNFCSCWGEYQHFPNKTYFQGAAPARAVLPAPEICVLGDRAVPAAGDTGTAMGPAQP